MAGSTNDLWFQCPKGELLRLGSRLRLRRRLYYAGIVGVVLVSVGTLFGGYKLATSQWVDDFFSPNNPPGLNYGASIRPLRLDEIAGAKPIQIQTTPLPPPPKDNAR
jgi:hypothetical protein